MIPHAKVAKVAKAAKKKLPCLVQDSLFGESFRCHNADFSPSFATFAAFA